MNKINSIPISLILAQSIIESGWGASRFAQEGNALFGQWTWKDNDGIKPKGNLDANFSEIFFPISIALKGTTISTSTT